MRLELFLTLTGHCTCACARETVELLRRQTSDYSAALVASEQPEPPDCQIWRPDHAAVCLTDIHSFVELKQWMIQIWRNLE